jgi:4-amino-4-deoxy-L-arabinose transferase-like glycosyltransferase
MDKKGKKLRIKNKVMFPATSFAREDARNLFFLLVVGLILRLYGFFQIYMIAIDGVVQYIPVAKLFYYGEYFQALGQPQLPLYPFLISILTHITGNLELSGQLISIIFSLLAVFPIYLIAKLLFGPKPAFWATSLYLVNPLMLHSSVDVLKEGLLIFLFFSSVYCSLRFLQEGKIQWLISTVVFAAAGALVSIIALVVLAVLGGWVVYHALREREKERKLLYRYRWSLIIVAGMMVLFFLLALLGWDFLSTKKPYKVVEGMFYQWFVSEWPSLPQIGERLLYILDRFIEKTYYVSLPFAIFGLVWKVRTREFSAEERYLALLIGVLIVIFFPNLYASGRYHLPAIFLLYLLAGFGFAKILELIDMRFTKYRRLVSIILVIILFGSMVSFSLQPQRLDKVGYKKVGLLLRQQQLPSSPLILTDDPRVAYYAGGTYLLIPPEARPEDIVKKGEKEKADYLVIEGKGSEIPDAFAPFEKRGALKLVLSQPQGRRKGRIIYLYKMKK